jgi:DNA repair exonuclease SbcCD ATPase subunit
MEDKLTQEVAQIIERILAGKDEEEKRARTEQALRESASTIESLTSKLESANDKIEELNDQIKTAGEAQEELDSTKVEEAEAAEKAAKEAADKIAELEAQLQEKAEELDNIKKDALATARMDELTTAGVAREDVDAQTAKVKEMSDEEFAAYKEELESVRASVLAELKKNTPQETVEEKKAREDAEAKAKADAEAAGAEENAGEENAGEENASEEDDEGVTPPPEVDPAMAAYAHLNSEIYPSEDMQSQYNDLGKALAEAVTKKD